MTRCRSCSRCTETVPTSDGGRGGVLGLATLRVSPRAVERCCQPVWKLLVVVAACAYAVQASAGRGRGPGAGGGGGQEGFKYGDGVVGEACRVVGGLGSGGE